MSKLTKGKDDMVMAWEAAKKVKAGLAERNFLAASVKDEKAYTMEISRSFQLVSEKGMRKAGKLTKLVLEVLLSG